MVPVFPEFVPPVAPVVFPVVPVVFPVVPFVVVVDMDAPGVALGDGLGFTAAPGIAFVLVLALPVPCAEVLADP